MLERHQRLVSTLQRACVMQLEMMAGLLHSPTIRAFKEGISVTLDSLKLESVLLELIVENRSERVEGAALRCARHLFYLMRAAQDDSSNASQLLQFCVRSALDTNIDTWIQIEALGVVAVLSQQTLATVVHERLSNPMPGDDCFVRQAVVDQLLVSFSKTERGPFLFELALADASATVRQRIAMQLHCLPKKLLLDTARKLMLDPSSAVRCELLEHLGRLEALTLPMVALIDLYRRCSDNEHDSSVLRYLLDSLPRVWLQHQAVDQDAANHWLDYCWSVLETLHSEAQSLAVRRWAAQVREVLWCQTHPHCRALKLRLQDRLARLPLQAQRSIGLPPGWREFVSPEELARVLSILAQEDFGFDLSIVKNQVRVTRWQRFGFRLWRLIHELRNPSSDKRQGVSHTTGDFFFGNIAIPSAILCEQSATTVPGEPLLVPEENGWRPYLPLVDQVISSLDQGWPAQPLLIYTSEGITHVQPPNSIWTRLRARWHLTWRFAHYSRLRNLTDANEADASSYMRALVQLGFSVKFRNFTDPVDGGQQPDRSVSRFFPVLLPPFLTDWYFHLESYFFSVYQNTLKQLVVFLVGIFGIFVGRHIAINLAIRRMRQRIPLVIGGWGTRGKSGTERLKAALFNGLGMEVVCKTTGCEAMFLHAFAHSPLREMTLFRPYEKATIWEQVSILKVADQLSADVLLWECMGLTPGYVDTLQRRWMQDDYATITNAYPDHENLQGPAGYNIPQVMAEFVPKNSCLISSEEWMAPILKQACVESNTRYVSSDWKRVARLNDELLARFPYEEHPNNVALALTLAEELGIDPFFALKEMADRVVPDTGVLKRFPKVQLQGRTLVFVNGMSANERLACLSNWHRMQFDESPSIQPHLFRCTLVNNRADRVARSQVFAKLIVNELHADCHFIVGSNIEGLMGFIDRAWKVHLSVQWRKLCEITDPDEQTEFLLGMAENVRICTNKTILQKRIEMQLKMLGVTEPSDLGQRMLVNPEILNQDDIKIPDDYRRELIDYVETQRLQLKEWTGLVARWMKDSAEAKPQFIAVFDRWFRRKLVVIDEQSLGVDAVLQRVLAHTPPGLECHLMGIQNIKGVGLDMIYAFQQWEQVYASGRQMLEGNAAVFREGLLTLASIRRFNFLCDAYLENLLSLVGSSIHAQTETNQAQLNLIESKLRASRDERYRRGHMSRRKTALERIFSSLEGFIDAGDAIKRRKRANQIYRDLRQMQISHSRAAVELQRLNQRQRGGWLYTQVRDFVLRFFFRSTN